MYFTLLTNSAHRFKTKLCAHSLPNETLTHTLFLTNFFILRTTLWLNNLISYLDNLNRVLTAVTLFIYSHTCAVPADNKGLNLSRGISWQRTYSGKSRDASRATLGSSQPKLCARMCNLRSYLSRMPQVITERYGMPTDVLIFHFLVHVTETFQT